MNCGAMLRAARTIRRVSQRELADLAAVPHSTVDRIEAGRTVPRVTTMSALLGAVGYELVVRTVMDRPLPVDEQREELRDGGGRRFPAHLPLDRPRYMGEGPNWWGWHRIAWPGSPSRVPQYMYWHPARRTPPQLGDPVPSPLGYVWDDAT